MKIAELFVQLGAKGGDSVITTLSKIKTSTTILGVSIGYIINKYSEWQNVALKTAQTIDKFTAFTGRSAQDLQKLSFELGQSGVSLEQISGTLANLDKQRTNMLLGRGFNPAFVLLGIDPRTDPVKMLEQIKDRIGQIKDPNTARVLATQLGISEDIYYALKQDTKQYGEFAKALTLTEKQRKQLIKFNQELRSMGWYFEKFKEQLVSSVLTTALSEPLNEVMHIFEWGGEALVKFGNYLNSIKLPSWLQEAVDWLDQITGKGWGSIIAKQLEGLINPLTMIKNLLGTIEEIVGTLAGKDTLLGRVKNKVLPPVKEIASNGYQSFKNAGGGSDVKIVTNTNNFYGYDNPKEIANEVETVTEKDVSDVTFESSAQAGE